MPEMPAPMMMASKSGIGVAPVFMEFWMPKLPALAPVDKPRMDAWQGCRFAAGRLRLGFTRDRICPYRRGSDRPKGGDGTRGGKRWPRRSGAG